MIAVPPRILTFLESIMDKSLGTRVLLLPHTWNEEVLIDALFMGIRGYLTATLNSEQFIKAIRAVRDGEMWIERKITAKAFSRFVSIRNVKQELLKSNLTKREGEIVRLVIQGYSTKRISSVLGIWYKEADGKELFGKYI